MGKTSQQHMFQCFQLPGESRVDARIGMTKQVDPPGADGIKVAVTLEILEPYALAGFDRDDRERLVVLHLRAGMPQNGEIASGEFSVVHVY